MSRNSISSGPRPQSSKSGGGKGYNYQKEVRQLKKDMRLKDEKMTLLQREVQHKDDTIKLLQEALRTKDEQLSIKDEEYINFEQNVRLLTEKCEALEKHIDELKSENAKQLKLATIASKRVEKSDAVNESLRNEINMLAASISTLRLTMSVAGAVGGGQNTFTFAPSTTQIVQNVSSQPVNEVNQPGTSHNNNNSSNVHSDHIESEHGSSARDSESDTESQQSEGPVPPFPRASSMLTQRQMKKKRKQMKAVLEAPVVTRKRSGSGGSLRKKKRWEESDDYDAQSVGSNQSDQSRDRDRGKVKGRKYRSVSMSTKGMSVGKRMKIEETVPEILEEFWDDEKHEDGATEEDCDFGNAPLKDRRKKRKKNKEWTIFFDTHLDGLDDQLKIENGTTINMDCFTDSLYVISSVGMDRGKHEWEIEVMQTGDLTDEIGICSAWGDLAANNSAIMDMGSAQLGARAVYANDPSTGVAIHDAYDENNKLTFDKKFKKKGSAPSEWVWGKGDVIKVAVNCNKWTCKFYLNDKQVGKSIAMAKDRMYYPIICAYGSCSYRVISYS